MGVCFLFLSFFFFKPQFWKEITSSTKAGNLVKTKKKPQTQSLEDEEKRETEWGGAETVTGIVVKEQVRSGDQGRTHYEILLTFSWGYYSFPDIYSVLATGFHQPNQKDSWGSRLFLLSKTITFHLLKDSTPQLSSQGQGRYISRSECTTWKMIALWCAFSLTEMTFSHKGPSWLNSKPDTQWLVCSHKSSKLRTISENILPCFWVTVHVI